MEKQEFIIKTAYKAGDILRQTFGQTLKTKTKSVKGDIVTEVDLMSEAYIILQITKKFPEHNILSEEKGSKNNKSEYTWIIDPLDGTRNYSLGIPMFGVTIALAHKNEIVLGVIFDPIHDELYFTQKGKGAYLNGNKIRVNNEKEIEDMVYGIGGPRQRINIKKYSKWMKELAMHSTYIRTVGSAVQELSMVGIGRSEASILGGCWPWDVAAGGLLIQEAGGKITKIDGKKWDPLLDNQEILATNSKVHNKILKLIK